MLHAASSNCTKITLQRDSILKDFEFPLQYFWYIWHELDISVSGGLDIIERDVFFIWKRTYLKVTGRCEQKLIFPTHLGNNDWTCLYQKNLPKHVDRTVSDFFQWPKRVKVNNFLLCLPFEWQPLMKRQKLSN